MTKKSFVFFSRYIKIVCAGLFILINTSDAQTGLQLSDLSFFKSPSANWRIAGDVNADLNTKGLLTVKEGAGVLVNTAVDGGVSADLFSNQELGDMDLQLDYMMSKESNSGIYLQGRYEIQLRDSWGVLNPKASDNGGIYERWDESKPEGQKGFEGYAPRQNVSKAPGLWQHLKISFQAPRFVNGTKTENAKLLRVELNGVLIHENIEIFGPTRGGLDGETAKAALRLQGDHGTVAFRNISITGYDKTRPQLQHLQYAVYKGPVTKEPDYSKARTLIKGSSATLTTDINNLPDTFILRYTGVLKMVEPGEYNFNLFTFAGTGSLTINNQKLNATRRRGSNTFTLPAGDLPFELVYSKTMDWGKATVGLTVSGPGIREFMLSDANNLSNEQTDPILIDAPVNTLLRSFMDIPGTRVVHAVSVGSPEGLHYTYDMDNSSLVQIWRGEFLDATPMWHERGDGSSRPRGSKQLFGKPALTIGKLSSSTEPWKPDTAGTGFRPKGYELDEKEQPVFHYFIYGIAVDDATHVLENRQGLSREIAVVNPPNDLFARLATSKTIEDMGNGLYLLGDKSYYLKIEDTDGGKVIVRDSNDNKELVVAIKSKLKYSILF
jgi:hypothetical protein